MDRFRAYGWPGNIRELQSVLKQAVLCAHGFTLLPAFLPALPETTTIRPREPEVIGHAPVPSVPAFDVESFDRRIPTKEKLVSEIKAWERRRNRDRAKYQVAIHVLTSARESRSRLIRR